MCERPTARPTCGEQGRAAARRSRSHRGTHGRGFLARGTSCCCEGDDQRRPLLPGVPRGPGPTRALSSLVVALTARGGRGRDWWSVWQRSGRGSTIAFVAVGVARRFLEKRLRCISHKSRVQASEVDAAWQDAFLWMSPRDRKVRTEDTRSLSCPELHLRDKELESGLDHAKRFRALLLKACPNWTLQES